MWLFKKVLLLSLFVLTVNIYSAGVFEGGDGSENNPYQISTIDQFVEIKYYLSANFILLNDIDFSGSAYDSLNSTTGWTPIGNSSTPFTGSFNGRDKVIKNLYINRPTQSYVGLFGALEGAELSHIALEEVYIKGDDYTGALAGYALNGANDDSTKIVYCSSSGYINGDNYSAGLVGLLQSGNINKSYTRVMIYKSSLPSASGEVSIAIASGSTSNITSSHYSTILFHYKDDIFGAFDHIFNSFGDLYNEMYVLSGFSEIVYKYGTESENIIPLSYVNLYSETISFEILNAPEGVSIYDTDKLKVNLSSTNNVHFLIRMNMGDSHSVIWPITLKPNTGDGTVSDPYQIYTIDQLKQIKDGMDKHYVLKADLNFSGSSWEPLNDFTGTFDGENHTISNFSQKNIHDINANNNDYGFFRYATNAKISNLKFSNVSAVFEDNAGLLVGYLRHSELNNIDINGTIDGYANFGGVVGLADSSIIRNVKFSGEMVSGSQNNIGGIVARTIGCTLDSLTFDGIMRGGITSAGAIVGNSDSSTINNSTATGEFATLSTGATGGIVGLIKKGSIKNSISYMTLASSIINVSGSKGGLIGVAENSNIDSCYSYGEKVRSADYVGGFIGELNNSTLTNSYSSTNVIKNYAGGYYAGGFVGSSNNSIISHSHASGDIIFPKNYISQTILGGFVGVMEGGTITSSYTTSIIKLDYDNFTSYYSGELVIGNFVGKVKGDNSTIENTYTLSSITANNISGITDDDVYSYKFGGYAGDSIKIEKSYSVFNDLSEPWDDEISPFWGTNNTEDIGSNYYNSDEFPNAQNNGLTNSQMLSPSSFENWDINTASSAWQQIEGTTFPVLKGINNTPYAVSDAITGSFSELLDNDMDFEGNRDNFVYKLLKASNCDTKVEFDIDSLHTITPDQNLCIIYRSGEQVGNNIHWGNATESQIHLEFDLSQIDIIDHIYLKNRDDEHVTRMLTVYDEYLSSMLAKVVTKNITYSNIPYRISLSTENIRYTPSETYIGNDTTIVELTYNGETKIDTIIVHYSAATATITDGLNDLNLTSSSVHEITLSDLTIEGDPTGLELVVESSDPNVNISGTSISFTEDFIGSVTISISLETFDDQVVSSKDFTITISADGQATIVLNKDILNIAPEINLANNNVLLNVKQSGYLNINILNVKGNISFKASEYMNKGKYNLSNTLDNKKLSSGTYFIIIKQNGFISEAKFVIYE